VNSTDLYYQTTMIPEARQFMKPDSEVNMMLPANRNIVINLTQGSQAKDILQTGLPEVKSYVRKSFAKGQI